MKLTPRERTALWVAPLAAPVVFTVVVAFPGILKGMPGFFEALLIVVIFGAPIAYIVAAVLGLPALSLARRFKLVNFWSLSFGGAAIAMLVLLVLWLFGGGPNTHANPEPWVSVVMLGVCGFSVGVVFWLVAYYRPHNNRLVRTPESTRHVS